MRLSEFSSPVKPYLCRIICDGKVITTLLHGSSENEIRMLLVQLFGQNAIVGITTYVQVFDDVGDNQFRDELDMELTGDGLVKKMALNQLTDGKIYGATGGKRMMNKLPLNADQLRVKALQNKVDLAKKNGDQLAASRARNDVQVEKTRQAKNAATKKFMMAANKAGKD